MKALSILVKKMARRKDSNTTISDVAKLAGVSVTTVSRVLNGEKYVREDKKTAVDQAVKKLEYQPNVYARSLAGDRSYLIGLLFDDPRGDYLSGMQRGAMRKCREIGYHLVVERFDETATLDEIRAFLTKLSLTGVVLTPPVCDNKIILAALESKKIPTVRIASSMPYPGMADIRIDDYQAAFQMTEHLIGLGHENIGFITGDLDHADARERLRAFRDAMEQAGLSVNEAWMARGTYQFDSGIVAARAVLALKGKRPTAIFAANDDMAAAVIVVARELGISVPEELSVAGFDDIPLASAVSPALTTIRQPVIQMAEVAIETLMKIIRGDDSVADRPHMMPVEFVRRGSTQEISKK